MLGELAETGFAGKLGLSVDKFHGIHTAVPCPIARTTIAGVSVSFMSTCTSSGGPIIDGGISVNYF